MSQVHSLVDGVPCHALDVADRGFCYGDGVFRTLAVSQGQPRWWSEQFAKLAADCARLDLPCPDEAVWRADLAQLPLDQGALKLTVTRGSGERGYRPPSPCKARRLVQFQAMPLPTPPVGGANLRICALRLGWQPRLAGIKHLNRLENVLARAEWQDPEIHEGLLLDQAGQVIGGTMSNLFVVRDGGLFTPRLERCGVAGATRARLLAAARARNVAVVEAELDLADVLEAEALFLTNSLIGLWPVRRLGERHWAESAWPQRCKEWLDV